MKTINKGRMEFYVSDNSVILLVSSDDDKVGVKLFPGDATKLAFTLLDFVDSHTADFDLVEEFKVWRDGLKKYRENNPDVGRD